MLHRRMRQGISLAVVLLFAGALGYLFRGCSEEPEAKPTPVVEVRGSASVVKAMRKLAQLQGATLRLERVIDLREKQSRFFGLLEAEDAILLVAAGEVTAGVDLAGMKASDVTVDAARQRVTLVLPHAEILSARLDNEHTYVHSRDTDTLASRQVQLETKARQEAERGFRKAAVEAKIEQLAEDSVARTVTALVTSLGFERVDVVFSQRPSDGEGKP